MNFWLLPLLLLPGLSQDEQSLLAAYRTAPQGYPKCVDDRGAPYAQPDVSTSFRWHFFNDSVPRADDAGMKSHVQAYNPLDGEGVSLPEKQSAGFRFVADHATSGAQSLRIDFDAAAVDAARAAVRIHEIVGPSYMPG